MGVQKYNFAHKSPKLVLFQLQILGYFWKENYRTKNKIFQKAKI